MKSYFRVGSFDKSIRNAVSKKPASAIELVFSAAGLEKIIRGN